MRMNDIDGSGGIRGVAVKVPGWWRVGDRLRTRVWRIVLAVGAAVVVAMLALPGRPAAQTEVAAPVIASVQVDVALQRLTINGLNFGTTAPTVTLALSALTVLAPTSATSVQATLPTLLPGTYLLVLERTDEELAVFYLTLGAVGPAGPPGPAVYQ